MQSLIWFIVAFAALIAVREHDSSAPTDAITTMLDDIAIGALEQAESTFAYDVVERATDRTNDDLRALDVNVNGLLAVQAAIYAILIDKLDEFSIVIRVSFVIAIALGCFNLYLGRGKNVPNPETFRGDLQTDALGARERVMDALLDAANANDQLLERKRMLFVLALGITLTAALAAPFVPSGRTLALAPGPTLSPASSSDTLSPR